MRNRSRDIRCITERLKTSIVVFYLPSPYYSTRLSLFNCLSTSICILYVCICMFLHLPRGDVLLTLFFSFYLDIVDILLSSSRHVHSWYFVLVYYVVLHFYFKDLPYVRIHFLFFAAFWYLLLSSIFRYVFQLRLCELLIVGLLLHLLKFSPGFSFFLFHAFIPSISFRSFIVLM